MVIEAVPERIDLKTEVFGELDRLAEPNAILATNSSSLPSSRMISKVKRPRADARPTATCRRSCQSPIDRTPPPGTGSPAPPRTTRTKPRPNIAYSGPFHVDEDKKTLAHSMFVSLFPDWTGQTQPRAVKIENDILHSAPCRRSNPPARQ